MKPDRIPSIHEIDALSRQVVRLADDTEMKGLPFVATALRNLTALINAEYKVVQSLSHEI